MSKSTLLAKSALLSINPETNETNGDLFVGGTQGKGPIAQAHALKDSIERDFPDRLFAVAANDEARRINNIELQRSLGYGPRPSGDVLLDKTGRNVPQYDGLQEMMTRIADGLAMLRPYAKDLSLDRIHVAVYITEKLDREFAIRLTAIGWEEEEKGLRWTIYR